MSDTISAELVRHGEDMPVDRVADTLSEIDTISAATLIPTSMPSVMGAVGGCLDDIAVLAIIERRLSRNMREVAAVHVDACRRCRELLVAIAVCFDARAQESVERELELALDER